MRSSSRFVAVLVCAACFAVQQQPHHASARSVFANIPGAELMRDLSHNFMQTVGDIFDNSIGSAISEVSALAEPLEQCTDAICTSIAQSTTQALDPDAKRNVSEIIRSRGFHAEEYDVITRDGYILTIQRIVNPMVDAEYRAKLKPVILQHGLMSSSVDWVINSVNVYPEKFPPASKPSRRLSSMIASSAAAQSSSSSSSRNYKEDRAQSGLNSIGAHQASLHNDTQEHPNSLGFYLANRGYDVFLANSRGNVYAQRHVNMSSWSPKFWDFTFDEQIKYDLPDVIEFVQRKTNHTKVGYVGHSQGTTMIFGLLADRPEYADIVEPVVALAPVAYVNNCLSPVKYFAVYTPIFQHINMWFGSSNVAVRYLAPRVCSQRMIRKKVCANIVFLSCGFDEAEFDESRVSAYLSHMPSGTSVKNIAHWGQEVLSGKFAHFDHGILANQIKYGQAHPPEYDLAKIASKSIVLFSAENDWLASPKDVARLKADLKVPLFGSFNVSESVPNWNHIDFVYGKDTGRLVNARIVEIFDHFNQSP